jgi:hypothetical protein
MLVPNVVPELTRFFHSLSEFFIKFLTEPGDLVVDPFAGSNITGEVAERLGRRWLAFEIIEEYLEASRFRFTGSNEQPPLFTTQAETLDTGVTDEVVSQPTLLESRAQYDTDPEK